MESQKDQLKKQIEELEQHISRGVELEKEGYDIYLMNELNKNLLDQLKSQLKLMEE